MKTKNLCCITCGNNNIKWQMWADENYEASDLVEDGTVYCYDCFEITKAVLKKKYQKGMFWGREANES